MSSPPPKSLVPAPTVWPPSNPSGTVIPFPLPWGQTGCCPPGGMDALMKCYCDLQQASAFIGQVMLDQINNNPAQIEAIIAGIEASGSSLPTIGVTNGSNAQPGQVGEWVEFVATAAYTAASQTQNLTMGVLQPGDWDCTAFCEYSTYITGSQFILAPQPAGFSNTMFGATESAGDTGILGITTVSPLARASISVPSLVVFSLTTNGPSAGPSAGQATLTFDARRAR